MTDTRRAVIDRSAYDAVVFDMDGVVTRTAVVHAAAWRRLFDDFMAERARETGDEWRPFDVESDYRVYVDGKPRYDGVSSFLESRGIVLPHGSPDDPPDRATVCGLGNRKNGYFLEELDRHGVQAYETTVRLVRALQGLGIGTAIISASKNLDTVLGAAGLSRLFPVKVDGILAAEIGLAGKPDPAVFLEAARRLDASPARTVVVEDALSGVEAGRRGAFGLVIGVDRTGDAEGLLRAGADVVVPDLGEVELEPPFLPSAIVCAGDIERRLHDPKPALFLDYDGTLTPIVAHPDLAVLGADMRAALEALAARFPVAIISGRDLADLKKMVTIDGVVYSGSHGFDVDAPDCLGGPVRQGGEFAGHLAEARAALKAEIAAIEGAWVEDKAFAVTVHFRQTPPQEVPRVETVVREVASRFPQLRVTTGKMVLELRPAIDWDKGRALLWLLERLEALEGPLVPAYLGDDDTDEDAFRAVAERGVGVKVGDAHEKSAAAYSLRDVDEVLAFLRDLATLEGDAG